VLYGGDMTEGDRKNEKLKRIESALRNVQTRRGAYGVTGNHEFYGSREKGDFSREAGITLLCDTVIRIDSTCYLAGRYDEHFRRRKTIGELLDSIPDDLPVIVLDHRPTQMQEVSRTKTAVQFSGHTHNGQLFPVNLITRRFYELTWGYKKIRNTYFFVSSGIRLWGPPVRTVGKSEIMLVDIRLK
jgi:predicted MPP superfamily phosphohydrolase